MKKTIYICDLCGKQMMVSYLNISVEAEEGTTEERDLCETCTMKVRRPGQEPKEPEEKPKKKDKKKVIDRGKVMALHNAGWSAGKIADEMGCSVTAIYLILKEDRDKKEEEE